MRRSCVVHRAHLGDFSAAHRTMPMQTMQTAQTPQKKTAFHPGDSRMVELATNAVVPMYGPSRHARDQCWGWIPMPARVLGPLGRALGEARVLTDGGTPGGTPATGRCGVPVRTT